MLYKCLLVLQRMISMSRVTFFAKKHSSALPTRKASLSTKREVED